MGGNSYDEYSVEFVHETDNAILICDGDDEIWLPKSQLRDFEEWTYKKRDEITIEVPEWLATEEELC